MAAKKSLVIVESPAKAHTINDYLGTKFTVLASMGHVRDLPKTKLGIDIENRFTPSYLNVRGRSDIIKKLKKAAANAPAVYLATDLDREGEAIAWHLAEILKFPPEKTYRIIFNEITKRAILEAVGHPQALDMNKVNAQQARRILDRIVGYTISPILWAKVARGLSAGRVQSVAVRFIVEREKEIRAFVPVEFWKAVANLAGHQDPTVFAAELKTIDGAEPKIPNEAAAKIAEAEIKSLPFVVAKIEAAEKSKKPWPPFTTSLLQQSASSVLGFSAKKTMMIAQQLYEGMDIGEEGAAGLITYMRTDSFRVADEAISETRAFIEKTWSKNYLSETPNIYKSKKNSQGAHEAIRPTDVRRTPEALAKFLTRDQIRLYELIWKRAVATQMANFRYLATDAAIDAGRYGFRAAGRKVVFDGFTVLEGRDEDDKDQSLPPLAEGETLRLDTLNLTQSFTKPPPRYSEASLVRTLEKEGIGRPSTYAPILSTIQDRGYVLLKERAFHATELGMVVTDLLLQNFPVILDAKFTSHMEESLDEVEDGGADWVAVLQEFYTPFDESIQKAKVTMTKIKDQTDVEGRKCEKCGKDLVVRLGRYGRFLACTGFPECKFTQSLDQSPGEAGASPAAPEKTNEVCPKCGSPMLLRVGRRGKFLACSAYPKCKSTKSLPTGVKCPTCGTGDVVSRWSKRGRSFFGCSRYPDCDFIANRLPTPEDAAKTEEAPKTENTPKAE